MNEILNRNIAISQTKYNGHALIHNGNFSNVV